ncbi:MAG: DUF4145 domain-containing protein [Spirirestis rafaelensis WJT71-NPBG6]|jgi:hypothetical protein|nr:DUF4145 domain-containing protein [Spirirestis rafaelensis WJT71-NPBG6]
MYQINLIGEEYCSCGSVMKCEAEHIHKSCEDDNGHSIEVLKILICLTCNKLTVILYETWVSAYEEEMYGYENNPQQRDLHDLYREYTKTVLLAPKINLDPCIPEPIAQIIYEAQLVLGKSARASFILCRAVLEEICNDFDIPSKNTNKKGFIQLHDRLKLLVEKEKISDDLNQIIGGIKELGNEGAHSGHVIFSEKVQNKDAENLLELVNYIVERLYVDKYRQEEAKKGLAQLKNKILPP